MDGQVRETEAGYELRFERHFKQGTDELWAALTRPERLDAWLAEAEVEPVPGGRIKLTWLNSHRYGSRTVAHGKITAIEPPRLIEYETDLHGRLRWQLAPEPGECVLRFTAVYPRTVESVARMLAGWHIHLDHLAGALEGQRVDWPRWEEEYWGRFTEYYDRYAGATGERQ